MSTDLSKLTTAKQCDDEIQKLQVALSVISKGNPAIALIQTQIDAITRHKQKLSATKLYDHLKSIRGYSVDLQKCIEKTVDNLLDPNTEDPSVPGLLLGRIQSGKTRAYVGVMALAFDRGFDACVVLTKPDDGLVSQTKARLEWEFEDFADTPNATPSIIVSVYDVNKSMVLNAYQCTHKNIFVLHKNTARLKSMKKILDSSYKNKKVLIIDDEADFVSRTFYSQQQVVRGGVIGFRIDDLTSEPSIDFYYLQVTATAYSLFLQPQGTIEVSNGTMSCFHPRFTVLVPRHNQYVGGEEYFVKSQNAASMYSFLFHPISDDCFDRLLVKNSHGTITRGAAYSIHYCDLREAIMSYFVGSAIRQLQERAPYKTSFLLHCSTAIEDHQFEQRIVSIILNDWQNKALQNPASLLLDFSKAYNDLKDSIDAGNQFIDPITNKTEINVVVPSANDTYDKVIELFSRGYYIVQCINGETAQDPNLFEKNGQLKLTNLLNFFIGGYKTDRGITVDNMIGFMYGRRPRSGGAANTILQHMRQYGSRNKKDMAVTRFHTTYTVYQKLADIYVMDEVLRTSLAKNSTPSLVQIQYDPSVNSYSLCSPSQTRMSVIQGLEKFGRIIATPGFQTKDNATISPIIQPIDRFLASNGQPGQPFLIDKAQACSIIQQIRETFKYDRNPVWDEKIMIGAIEQYAPNDDKIWCYYTSVRDLSRMRSNNSKYSDAPDTAQTDTPLAKKYATNRPFFMLIKEKGERVKGWNDAQFYWPVLRLPHQMTPAVYCVSAINEPRTMNTLSVTLQDGSVIQKQKISDTLIECIKRAGPDKVEALNIVYRNNNLIYAAGRQTRAYYVIEPRKYYLRKGIGSQKAKDLLEEISRRLSLGWVVTLS